MFHRQRTTAGFLACQLFSVGIAGVVLEAASRFQTVTDALGFYGVYHREPLNQLIHFVGVPGIIWTMIIFMAHLPLPYLGSYAIKMPMTASHPLNWGTFATLFYFFFYLKIDSFGGLLYTPVLYLMYATAVNMVHKDQAEAKRVADSKEVSWTGTGKLLRFAGFVHFLSWYVQIHPGHAVIEGAKPAILDSLGGALTSAPLFAFYEGLWFLGINRELQEKTLQLVAEHTVRLCANGASMRVCETL